MINQTVWKFPFQIADRIHLKMPRGAQVIHVDEQHTVPCLWALVDPSEEVVEWTFHIFGTGHPMPSMPLFHVATWQSMGGSLVWHMFEEVFSDV